jgi:YbbR domain-containing protein
MLKKLLKNPGIKVFCLLVAAVLWLYVVAGQNTVGKYPGSIKIKAINVPSGYEAIYDIKSVDIKILAEPSIWKKLSVDSFSAYVDLSGRTGGTYEIPVTVNCSVVGVSIVQKDPDQIIVRLEELITKEVDIQPKIEGSAGEGLIAGSVALEPSRTTIRGPRSIINSISEANAVIKLNGEKDSFERVTTISAFNENGILIKIIEFVPSETKAKVSIVKGSNNKTVGIKVVTSGQPKAGFYVSNISVTPNTVDIVGQSSVLSSTTYIETSIIDINQMESNLDKEVILNVKNGIALQTGSPTKVRVKIVLSKANVSREMTATINPQNLPAGYSITGYSTTQVKVVCFGPSDIISDLRDTDVVLNLNFSGKNITENNTTINFDLASTSFSVPEKVNVGTFLPSSLSVNLSK